MLTLVLLALNTKCLWLMEMSLFLKAFRDISVMNYMTNWNKLISVPNLDWFSEKKMDPSKGPTKLHTFYFEPYSVICIVEMHLMWTPDTRGFTRCRQNIYNIYQEEVPLLLLLQVSPFLSLLKKELFIRIEGLWIDSVPQYKVQKLLPTMIDKTWCCKNHITSCSSKHRNNTPSQQQLSSVGEDEPTAFEVTPPHHFPSTDRVREASTSPYRPHKVIDLHNYLHKELGVHIISFWNGYVSKTLTLRWLNDRLEIKRWSRWSM